MKIGFHMRILAFLFVALLAATTVHTVNAQADNGKLNVYRCTDSAGKVSLQDRPCADSGKQQVLEMARPVDAKIPDKVIQEKPNTVFIPPSQAPRPIVAPPDLYRCTDFDGKVRETEVYDTNPRCVPLWVLGYETSSSACSWVEDSCVRIEGKALCDRWQEKQKQAELDLRHSSSSQSAYFRSELDRFNQILKTSCR